jgi:hypothetical protein
MKRIIARLAGVLVVAAGLAVPATLAAAPAQASACHVFDSDHFGPTTVDVYDGVTVTHTVKFTVPAWSSCRLIRIRHFEPTPCSPGGFLYVRLRYFDGAGNSIGTTNFLEGVCGSDVWQNISWDPVPDGTIYHVEISAGEGHPFTVELMD